MEILDYRGRPRVQTVNDEPSKTVQSDAELGDVNAVMDRYRRTGIVAGLNEVEKEYRDVTTFSDFADVMRHARAAEEEFMKLPSKVREMFNHDAMQWLDTAHDPEKRQALLDKGLIVADPSLVEAPPASVEETSKAPPEPEE